MKITNRELKSSNFHRIKVLANLIFFYVQQLKSTNIGLGSFYVENNSRSCLTKQLQSMFKPCIGLGSIKLADKRISRRNKTPKRFKALSFPRILTQWRIFLLSVESNL